MGRIRYRNPETTSVRCPNCGFRTTKVPKECRRRWDENHPEGCECRFGSCWRKECFGALLVTQDDYTWALEKRQEEDAMGDVQVIGGTTKDGSVFETNITRSEAIDIVIEELRSSLEDAVKVAEKLHEDAKEAQKQAVDEAGKKLLASYAKDASFKLNYSYNCRLEIDLNIDRRRFPEKLKVAIKEYDRTKADLNAARNKLAKFNAAATRNRIRVLRASLESSVNGRQFLKKVDTLKATISRQLLAA